MKYFIVVSEAVPILPTNEPIKGSIFLNESPVFIFTHEQEEAAKAKTNEINGTLLQFETDAPINIENEASIVLDKNTYAETDFFYIEATKQSTLDFSAFLNLLSLSQIPTLQNEVTSFQKWEEFRKESFASEVSSEPLATSSNANDIIVPNYDRIATAGSHSTSLTIIPLFPKVITEIIYNPSHAIGAYLQQIHKLSEIEINHYLNPADAESTALKKDKGIIRAINYLRLLNNQNLNETQKHLINYFMLTYTYKKLGQSFRFLGLTMGDLQKFVFEDYKKYIGSQELTFDKLAKHFHTGPLKSIFDVDSGKSLQVFRDNTFGPDLEKSDFDPERFNQNLKDFIDYTTEQKMSPEFISHIFAVRARQ